jgi:two-component system nitrate/nitrite response regulator NarL
VTRVLVCCSTRLYGEGLAAVLAAREGIEVVGCATAPADCLQQAEAMRPELVLLEMAMAEGSRLIDTLIDRAPGSQVVGLAVPEVEGAVVACAEAGAAACVTREETVDELVETLSYVVRGESLCTPRTAGILMRRLGTLAALMPEPPDECRLTPRELEVLALVDEGLSNKQIAFRLCIELSTVKNHVHSILAKLGVDGRLKAAAVYRRRMVGSRLLS